MENFQAEIGIIGLATMGSNLARNIAGKGFKVVVYNRTPEVTQEFLEQYKSDKLQGETDLKKFINQLALPRKIILLIKAGEPVDAVINSLLPLLSVGDTIIDCGNSHFRDSMRRSETLKSKQINFVGCGVSGGEIGALNGPSLMFGGNGTSWQQLQAMFQAIAAKDFALGPCVAYVGDNGAGHYVKMVHNGIEYAIMQLLAESYQILKKVYGLKPNEIAEVFKGYNQKELNSYLMGISAEILEHKDDLAEGFMIDKILDQAEQKGTGKWTVTDALDRGVTVSTISEAVFARVTSANKQKRTEISKRYQKENPAVKIFFTDFVEILEKALLAGILISYSQGFDLLQLANKEQGWQIDLAELARIWQGGCIIRAKILQNLFEAYKPAGNKSKHLFELPEFSGLIADGTDSLRQVVGIGLDNALAIPGFTNSLLYFDSMTSTELSANFIQGLRDYFGAHTYQRNDRPGTFHTKWN